MAKILLVDDDEDVLTTLRVLLKSEGHRVAAVTEGLEAMERLRSLEEIDLLVADLRMAPIDGLELIRVAREARPSLGIVVVSAYLDEKNIQRVKDLGCDRYVRKPFDIDEVLDAVRDVLIQKGPGLSTA